MPKVPDKNQYFIYTIQGACFLDYRRVKDWVDVNFFTREIDINKRLTN